MVECNKINKNLFGKVALSQVGEILIQLRFNKEAKFNFPLLWNSKPLKLKTMS